MTSTFSGKTKSIFVLVALLFLSVYISIKYLSFSVVTENVADHYDSRIITHYRYYDDDCGAYSVNTAGDFIGALLCNRL